ncbi:MAG: hypothetical protein LBK91_06705 [Synergistaceae bacterium]|jgi:hypothetical protein|nr:hypothetical protein [Synergistaceae bacterium]
MYELKKVYSAFLMIMTLSVAFASDASTLQVTNRKTDGYVAVPGTNVYFVPARELSAASAFGGFESKARRIEVIVANIDAPFSDRAGGFTDVSFQSKGMELKSRGDLTINGGRAILFKALHPDAGINWGKWIMLAENGDGTLVVNAVFISGDAEAASDLEIMLKGLYLDDTVQAAVPAAFTASEPDASAASGDVSTDRPPVAPSRLIISNELEPISLSEYRRSLSADFDGDAGRSSAASDITVSGDAFDRDAAMRMLSGTNTVSADGREEDAGTSASPEGASSRDLSSGDIGGTDVSR